MITVKQTQEKEFCNSCGSKANPQHETYKVSVTLNGSSNNERICRSCAKELQEQLTIALKANA